MREQFPFDAVASAYAGTIVYPPRGTYGPRIQQDIQLVMLHSGELELSIAGVLHAVKPGQAVLLKPGHVEFFAFAERQESWHRWITLGTRPLTDDQLAYMESLPFSMPIPEALNVITDLILSLQNDYAHHEEPIRSLGYAALSLFMSRTSQTKQQERHASVVLALNDIHRCYDEEITLPILANRAGVTPEHLVRLFHASQLPTPIRYLWKYRVVKATELLTQSGLAIGEIADRTGFKSAFHLSRLVKEQTGSTPSQLRKSAWGASE